MSVAELEKTKSTIIDWIGQLSDSTLIEFLDNLRTSNATDDWASHLSDIQKKHLQEGIDDAENGKVISSADFWENLKNV